MAVYYRWILSCIRLFSFSSLPLGVPAGRVDCPRDVYGLSVTADRHILSAAVQANVMELQLEVKGEQEFKENSVGVLVSDLLLDTVFHSFQELHGR